MTYQSNSAAPLQPLRYAISEGQCDAKLANALQVKLTDVLGSSPTVAAGQSYFARGEYMLTGQDVACLRLAGLGRTTGRPASVSSGSGRFEVTAEILEVVPGRDRVLDLLMADKDGVELGVRVRIELAK